MLTATSALSRRAPVANAFGESDGKIATCGMPIPAACACCDTVWSSHASVSLRGCVDHLRAGGADRHPLRDQQRDEAAAHAEHEGEDEQLQLRDAGCPRAARKPSSRVALIESTTITAMFVARKSSTRFMALGTSLAQGYGCDPATQGRRRGARFARESERGRVSRPGPGSAGGGRRSGRRAFRRPPRRAH